MSRLSQSPLPTLTRIANLRSIRVGEPAVAHPLLVELLDGEDRQVLVAHAEHLLLHLVPRDDDRLEGPNMAGKIKVSGLQGDKSTQGHIFC